MRAEGRVDRVMHQPASYGPAHLVLIGVRVFLTNVLRHFLDKRELQRGYSGATLEASAAGEVLVDYIADTGDGFTATYSVLRQLNPGQMGHGDILVLGGDEVYPSPTPENYQERFAGPLSDAVPVAFVDHLLNLVDQGELDEARARIEAPRASDDWTRHQRALLHQALRSAGRHDVIHALGTAPAGAAADPAPSDDSGAAAAATAPAFIRPWLLAIPGNHDWYDGLTEFQRQFMEPGTTIGGFETRQHRSYWAVDLQVDGTRWWLWGVDMSLDADVDRAQLDYFVDCGAAPGEPVVLFVPAPLWTYAEHRSDQLFAFERDAIHAQGRRLALVVSGDRHYYMRREAALDDAAGGRRADAPPRITAGLGGAFSHPPHLETTVPMLWTATPGPHGEARRTLPYVAATLPMEPMTDTGRGDVVDDERHPADEALPVTTFPTERDSRRMIGFRHSMVAWWRWNRAFIVVPFLLAFLTANGTLRDSEFWRQDADFSETTWWQIGAYAVTGYNLIAVLLLFGAAYALAAPDPAAHLQRTQRIVWTVLHGSALVVALWASTWAAQQLADWWLAEHSDVWEGVVFLLLTGVIGAFAIILVILGFFWVTNRAGMSVNAVATWNLEQNYTGFMRLRFTADAVSAEVYGITDVKTGDPEKIWKVVPDPRGTDPHVEPRWHPRPLTLVDRFRVDR